VIHFDTSFLVDLLREERRGEGGPAHRFLADLAGDEQACASVHVVCELHVGVILSSSPAEERQRVERLLATLSVVFPDDTFAPTYARLLADLRTRGATVSTMDLLIGTAAVCAPAPLVTGNPRHFRRIPDLEVLTYADQPDSSAGTADTGQNG
jgi:predicted nucleic acid-binding protein